MALNVTPGFPRELPTREDGVLPFESVTFEPGYQITRDPMRSGKINVANIGVELWSMTYVCHALGAEDAMDMLTWLHTLRGGTRKFKAWHPLLEFPQAYPNGFASMVRAGGGAFDGTCTVAAIGVTLDTITLSQLPAGFEFKRGDMVSFACGTSQTLHRVVAAATAAGNGQVTLTVEPTVPLAASANAAATVLKPWCYAVLDPTSVRGPLDASDVNRVQFSAMQSF